VQEKQISNSCCANFDLKISEIFTSHWFNNDTYGSKGVQFGIRDNFTFAKEERIDKQYYVTSKRNFILTKESAQDMLAKAENFLVHVKLIIKNLRMEEIGKIREKFRVTLGKSL